MCRKIFALSASKMKSESRSTVEISAYDPLFDLANHLVLTNCLLEALAKFDIVGLMFPHKARSSKNEVTTARHVREQAGRDSA